MTCLQHPSAASFHALFALLAMGLARLLVVSLQVVFTLWIRVLYFIFWPKRTRVLESEEDLDRSVEEGSISSSASAKSTDALLQSHSGASVYSASPGKHDVNLVSPNA